MQHSVCQNPAAGANDGHADLTSPAPLERENFIDPAPERVRALVEFIKVLFDAQQRENDTLAAENIHLRACLALLLRPAAEVLN